MAVPLPITSIIKWNRDGVICTPTEHNRSELSVDFDRISSSDRMGNGRLRTYHVADKRRWSCSWSMLPATGSEIVDGKDGGAAMEKFYRETPVEFIMSITHSDSNLDESAVVVFKNFSKTHVKRGAYDFWDISVSVEEV